MKLLFITLLLFLISCNDTSEEKKTSKTEYEIIAEKEHLLDSLNEVEAKNLEKKYEAVAGWDTAANFAFVFQEQFSKSKTISLIGEIKEAYKNDSSFIIQVKSTNSDIIAQIHVQSILFDRIKQRLKYENDNKGCFIFNVTKVIPSYPILSAEIEGSNEDAHSYPSIDYSLSQLKLEGKLIDFFYYKNIEQ